MTAREPLPDRRRFFRFTLDVITANGKVAVPS